MSRLNVEEVYWGDPRRALLIEKLGYGTADGFWLISIKLAEKFWVPNKECIPIKDWKAARLPDALFEVGFAELRNDGQEVYVFGSEEHFEWRFERIEAGRRGGLSRASKAKQSLTIAQANESKSKQTQASPSSSPSSSNNNLLLYNNKHRTVTESEVDRFNDVTFKNFETQELLFPKNLVVEFLGTFPDTETAVKRWGAMYLAADQKIKKDPYGQFRYLCVAMKSHVKDSSVVVTRGN